MVHSLPNSALLFPASKSRESTARVSLGTAIPMQSSRENRTCSPNGGRTLVVMAKAPKPGMVKTRLSPSLPLEAVTELYRCLLNDTIALARSLEVVDVAIMCPASDVEELTQLAPSAAGGEGEKRGGLPGGLSSVFSHLFALWPENRGAFY